MTTLIGAPFIPPDGVLLNVNTSTGALQLKPGTQGDILYADVSGVWSKLAAGTNGYYLKAQGAGVNPAWATPPGEGWTIITTLNPSAAASATASSLTAYDEYLIIGYAQADGAAFTDVSFRINNDSGTNYNFLYTTTSFTASGAQTSALIGTNEQNVGQAPWRIYCQGKTRAVASGQLHAIIQHASPGGANFKHCLMASWIGGNATQVNRFDFFPASGTFTGKIEIYGRVRP